MSRFKPAGIAPVNLDGQADGDYIRNDAGVWKPKTANEVMQDVLNTTEEWAYVDDFDRFLSQRAATNTGEVGTGVENTWRRFIIKTGATANSTYRASSDSRHGIQYGQGVMKLDFSRKIILNFAIHTQHPNYESANAQRWITLGEASGDAVADPAKKAIGIRIDNLAISGIVHDGATLTAVALGESMSAGNVRNIVIVSDGAGNVDWYYNGAYKASSAAGPTGQTANWGDAAFRMFITNNADAHDNWFVIMSYRMYFE